MRWPLIIGRNPVETVYFAAIFACGAILLLRFIGRWWHARRLARDGNARCATCGDILVPGSLTVCPECGNDVRDRGLITRSAPRRTIPLGPAHLLIALLSLPLAARASGALHEWHPFGWRYNAQVTVHNAARWCVQTEGTGRYFGRHPGHLMIYRNDGGDAQSVTLVIRPADLIVTYRGGWQSSQRIDRPLDGELLASFVRQTTGEAAYPDRRMTLDDATVARVSQEMLAAARLLAAGDVPTEEGRAAVGYSLDDRLQFASILCTAAIATAVGGFLLRRVARAMQLRKQRRWRREAARVGLIPPPGDDVTARFVRVEAVR